MRRKRTISKLSMFTLHNKWCLWCFQELHHHRLGTDILIETSRTCKLYLRSGFSQSSAWLSSSVTSPLTYLSSSMVSSIIIYDVSAHLSAPLASSFSGLSLDLSDSLVVRNRRLCKTFINLYLWYIYCMFLHHHGEALPGTLLLPAVPSRAALQLCWAAVSGFHPRGPGTWRAYS